MATAIVLVVLVLAAPAVYAADHTVGGSSGWTNFGTDYSTWAAGQTFSVGDNLLFNYDSSTHQVAEVSQSDYNSCSSSNAIKTYNDGTTKITLSKAGPMHFICPTAGHCSGGMKLAITVVAASTAPSTPAATTPSGSTPSNSNGTTSQPGPNGAAGSFSGTSLLVLGLGSMLVVALMG